MTPRVLRVAGPAILGGVTLIALVGALWFGGGAAQIPLGDAGPVVRWGLPVTKLVVNLAAAGMVGVLVTALFTLRAGEREFDVAPRGDGSVDITLVTRPRRSLVRVTGRRIQIMRQVNFVTDSDEILATSDPLLYEVADTLERHPEISSVEIEGHTDDRGGAEHNLTLSQRRAEAVRTWLIAHGVSAARLSARGYGLTRPLVPNITPANRARNRRVQFTIRESADANP